MPSCWGNRALLMWQHRQLATPPRQSPPLPLRWRQLRRLWQRGLGGWSWDTLGATRWVGRWGGQAGIWVGELLPVNWPGAAQPVQIGASALPAVPAGLPCLQIQWMKQWVALRLLRNLLTMPAVPASLR